MKKSFMIFIFLFTSISFAQFRDRGNVGSASIKLGYFAPNSTIGGFIIGYQGDTRLDENVKLGWSLDWFRRNYVDKAVVERFEEFDPSGGSTNELRAKTNIHQFPLQGIFSVTFPVQDRWEAYGSAGLGAELLLINYRNYQNPEDDDFHAALAFNWRISAGVSYELNARSEILGELTFHSSAPSWEYEYTDVTGRKRVFEREYDMSGIMVRIGYRFFY